MELTPANVVSFCDEATTLNSLQHANIVKCFGVAVMPPALCLVTEFCFYGSLFDFLHSLEFQVRFSRSSTDGLYHSHVVPNPQKEISKDQELVGTKLRSSVEGSRSNELTDDRVSGMEEGRRSTASKLADVMGESVENLYRRHSASSIQGHLAERSSQTRSSILSTSTLEKLGFSIHLSIESDVNEAETMHGKYFADRIERVSPSAHGRENRSLSASGIMKSAVSVLRSQDMGYGLGPSTTASGQYR